MALAGVEGGVAVTIGGDAGGGDGEGGWRGTTVVVPQGMCTAAAGQNGSLTVRIVLQPHEAFILNIQVTRRR